MDIYTNTNLHNNYVDNSTIRNSRIADWNDSISNPDPGSIKFDNNQLYYFNGAWTPVGGGGGASSGYFQIAPGQHATGNDWNVVASPTSGSGSTVRFGLENNNLTIKDNVGVTNNTVNVPIVDFISRNIMLKGDFTIEAGHTDSLVEIEIPNHYYSKYLQVSLYVEKGDSWILQNSNENVAIRVENGSTPGFNKVTFEFNNPGSGTYHFVIVGSEYATNIDSRDILISYPT